MNLIKSIPSDYQSLISDPTKYIKEFVFLSTNFDKHIPKNEILTIINTIDLDNHQIDIMVNCSLVQIIDSVYKYKVISVEITRSDYSVSDVITCKIITPSHTKKTILFNQKI